MTRKQNGLGLALAVGGFFLILLLVAIGLAVFTDGEDANPAVGFPIVLLVLAVAATAFALIWRAVTRRHHSDR